MRIGRIAGVEVIVHWTTLLAFALIASTLGGVVLPAGAEGYPDAAYWAVAIGVTTVFYASLLAHELSHAVVARHNAVPVHRITLWIFGGVASLEADAPDARTELHIAVAGPAMSVAVGVGTIVVATVAAALGAPELIVVGLAWLGGINLVLAVFNLIPAFPLDGGRALRAALWTRSGDRLRATSSAAHTGRIAAAVLMGLGALEVLAGGGIGGLWLVFIGWYLLAAAQREAGAVALMQTLGTMRVADVMTAPVVTVGPHLTVSDLVEAMWRGHYTGFPVVDADGRVMGMIDLHDVRRIDRDRWMTTLVVDVMTRLEHVPMAQPSDPANVLLTAIGREGQRRALVLDGGRVVGIVSATDLARLMSRADLVGV
jgi:Zn-dependent protease/predicted transcriptional regulator